MLVGRGPEQGLLGDLLRGAREGTGGALVLRGEPGVGKTALLKDAVRQAEGFAVVRVPGVESEADLAFAGLATLARPLVPALGAVAQPQRDALSNALALAPGPVASPFAAYLGFLCLLGAASTDRPLLVVADDIQWLDAPSAEALLFAARRIGADRVAIVMATRAGEDEALDLTGLTTVTVGGLAPPDARALLVGEHPDLAADAADALIAATAGVPLALLEIPRLLRPAQRRGDEPLPDPLPVGDDVRRAFHRTLSRLPADTSEALLLLAADQTGAIDTLLAALRERGVERAALQRAEDAGLIAVADGCFAFRHPVLRSTVYHAAPPSLRREAHATLAAVLDDEPDRQAWQLAAAAVGESEEVASRLAASAETATRRGAHGSAAAAWEKAAELTPDRAVRARRLHSAAEACRLGGLWDRGLRLVDRAVALSDDPLLRADIQLLRGRLMYVSRSMQETHAMLTYEARRVEALAPDRAATMLTEATWACTAAAEVALGSRLAERAHELGRRVGGATEVEAGLARAEALLVSGRTPEARALLAACKPALEARPNPLAPPFSPTSAMSYLVAEDYEFAATLMNGQVAAARDLGAAPLLAFVLGARADLHFRMGNWVGAYADATEAVALEATLAPSSMRPFLLVELARVEAGLGRDEAIEHAGTAIAMVARYGARSLETFGRSAVALLHLGHGRIHETIRQLEEVARQWEEAGCGDPNVVQWMPDLIEAYARAGRPADAAAMLETMRAQGDPTEGRWSRATAARCAGMLEDDFAPWFEAALEIHATSPSSFEEARTQLCFGERLRRAGRRGEARQHLRAALDAFVRLGAVGWRARAEAELGVTGQRAAGGPIAMDGLSPQELQVALIVGEGATNAEAASALFITPKTVEFHLRNVYRKLGLRSRTELARVIARSPDAGAERQDQGGAAAR